LREPGSPQETPYAEKTFGDRNRLKRYLQTRRLQDAIALSEGLPEPRAILDFGAGNGELCKRLRDHFPAARLVCFEPHPGLLEQAHRNLAGVTGIEFVSEVGNLTPNQFDLLFCLEVFEHLPAKESEEAIGAIRDLLSTDGHAVIGVPVEVGLPALYKGLFRLFRRYGDFDANVANILRATIGRPPSTRPEVELMPGSFYHLHHLGFDHRKLRHRLSREFIEVRASTSPMNPGSTWLNAELTMLLGTRGGAPGQSRDVGC
jgi:SAM-dependent methyltransferase